MFKLKIAFVGAGRIVEWCLNDAKLCKYKNQIELIGIFNHHLDRAIEKQKKYKIKKTYANFNELLSDKQSYNLAYVGTNDQTHFAYVKQLLGHKINVFCEKPLALNYKDAKLLYGLAKKNKVLLFEGIKTGFSPAYKKVKKYISDGLLGELCYVCSSHAKVSTSKRMVPNPSPNDNVSGFHKAGAMYELFTTLDICGAPKTITYMNESYPHNKALMTSILTMRHKNKCVSTSFGSEKFSDNLQTKICGTKGVILLGGNIAKYHKDYKKDTAHFAYTYEIYDTQQNLIKKEDCYIKTNGEGLIKEIEHVYELLKHNKIQSDVVPPAMSLTIIKIIELTNNTNDSKVIQYE
ncbi:MAG: Gfo/Idh/MocA family oxidoreductase [Mycoplasmataceae bacterium]|jgi:predicted dehydrogenase|nr:Gfo/Idh/MocA family oxidoreductase [Mycoplasmataceae bacterium]